MKIMTRLLISGPWQFFVLPRTFHDHRPLLRPKVSFKSWSAMMVMMMVINYGDDNDIIDVDDDEDESIGPVSKFCLIWPSFDRVWVDHCYRHLPHLQHCDNYDDHHHHDEFEWSVLFISSPATSPASFTSGWLQDDQIRLWCFDLSNTLAQATCHNTL